MPFFGLPSRIFPNSVIRLVRSSPTKIFVPALTVIGRSVLDLKVKHGMPKYVVSS